MKNEKNKVKQRHKIQAFQLSSKGPFTTKIVTKLIVIHQKKNKNKNLHYK